MKLAWSFPLALMASASTPALADGVGPEGVGRIATVYDGTYADLRITRGGRHFAARSDLHLLPDDLVTLGKAGMHVTIAFCGGQSAHMDDTRPQFLVPAVCSYTWSARAYAEFQSIVAAIYSPLSGQPSRGAEKAERKSAGVNTTPETFRSGDRILPSRVLPATEQRIVALPAPARLPVRWRGGPALVVLTSDDTTLRYVARQGEQGEAYLDVPSLPAGRYKLRIAGNSSSRNDLLIPVTVVDEADGPTLSPADALVEDARRLNTGGGESWQALIALQAAAKDDFSAQVLLRSLMDRRDF